MIINTDILAASAITGIGLGIAKASTGDYKARQAFNDVIWLSYSLARYYFGADTPPPAAVVAGIPLGSVEQLSHGISDREVRYRANGGIFLAHQDGGNESLRIIGKAWGDNRFQFLNMLDFLFMYGAATVFDVFQSKAEDIIIGLGPKIKDDDLTADPWLLIERSRANEGYNEQHMTFPVITKNRVYLSMYIETYMWRQTIDANGKLSITYTIFFRKYEPNPEYEIRELQLPSAEGEEIPKPVKVYKQKGSEESLKGIMFKSSMEVLASYAINLESVFGFTRFFAQWGRNLFGIPDPQPTAQEFGTIVPPVEGPPEYATEGFF